MKTILLSCIGTDLNISNPNLLCHFLDYYTDLGINEWALTLHVGINKELNNLAAFEQILVQYGISYQVWIEEFDTYKRESIHNNFVESQEKDTWIFGVDLDEFAIFPCQIPEYLETISELGYNCLCGRLVDRVGSNGTFKFIERNQPLSEQFPIVGNVKKNIYKPSTPKAPFEKKLAIKKPLQWGIGHHFINRETRKFQNEAPDILNISHYAWDHLLIERIKLRLKDEWAQEYLNMINYISKYGRLRLEDIREL